MFKNLQNIIFIFFYFQLVLSSFFFIFVATTNIENSKKPISSVTRTELKVSRSLNPENMQTLNVMTRDGSVAQLIVKRRNPKSKIPSNTLTDDHHDIYSGYRSLFEDYRRYGEYKPDYQVSSFKSEENYQDLDNKQDQEMQYPKAVFSKWIPIQSVYYQPKIVKLDSIALVRNISNVMPFSSPLGNVIDSDRYVFKEMQQ